MRKATRMGDTTSYVPGAILWASVTWTKGVRALQQGAVEAYDTIMVRLRYTESIHRQDRLRYDRRFWAIDSFNADKQDNTIQITAT
ncbi:MAG: head-tail adaptor protein, partial [Prevotellaceae bacterium]|nr:head-tail adaptor protein [Prevotellaceae bacterium]